MLDHYFKVAMRNFAKDKGYALINLIGLSFAVACSFLFLLWVQYEYNYESAHKNRDTIYRIISVVEQDGETVKRTNLPEPLGRALAAEFPAVMNATYLGNPINNVFLFNQEPVRALQLTTDKNFFDVFTFEFLQGSPSSAFEGAIPVIISEEFAKKLFGNNIADVNIVGQVIHQRIRPTVQREPQQYAITAVVRIPKNTHIRFDALFLAEKLYSADSNPFSWTASSVTTFIQVNRTAFNEVAKQQMSDYLLKHLPEDKRKLTFEPLTNIHLHSQVEMNPAIYGEMGSPRYIYIFLTLAFFVLIIAIINYVNLSVARGANRSREVGIRKMAGAYRRELILQFLFESFIWSLVAMLVAFALSEILVAWFANVIETPLTIAYNARTLLTAFGLAVFVTLLSGGYSAFYLSSSRPSITLKGGSSSGSKSQLRKTLLGIQLTLSALIILCTCIVSKQLHYMKTRDIGFDRFNVIRISTENWRGNDYADFKQEVLRNVNVEAVTNAWQAPFEAWYSPELNWEGKNLDADATCHVCAVDWDYAKVFKLQLLEGSFLPENMLSGENANEESRSKVLNETAAKMIGLQNIIGTHVFVGIHDKVGGKVVGVVKDFHIQQSRVHSTSPPMLFEYNPPVQHLVFIRISPHNQKATIEYIRNIFREFKKDIPFDYSFVTNDYMALYRNEFRMGKILLFCSLLSIFIACMGMFSLVAFMVEHRSKEICIRKINGAEMVDIISLFVREFSLLVCISFVLAAPVAWYFMHRWLMDFDYRIRIGVFIFLGVFAFIWILCMLTLVIQVYKAARRNPAESLKYE